MKVKNWSKKHKAILELIAYLDEQLPAITLEGGASSVFFGAAGVYRCNRYLQAIDKAVESGLGDTAGGNLRTLYETWVLGHLIMLGTLEEAKAAWAMARSSQEKITNAVGLEFNYPDGTPEAAQDIGVEQRAQALKKKLKTDDPKNAEMPILGYNYLYRAESLLSSHANTTSLTMYVENDNNGTIGLRNQNKDCEWRTWLGAIFTIYYAERVFIKAGLDTLLLETWGDILGADSDFSPKDTVKYER
jgi:hypothetical protein